jgi:uncharacterized integral membrane protein
MYSYVISTRNRCNDWTNGLVILSLTTGADFHVNSTELEDTSRECSKHYLIYLLTAIGLTHGGSSTVHIYTQTIHRTTQLTKLIGRLSGIRTQEWSN